jgi:hypothetical protein
MTQRVDATKFISELTALTPEKPRLRLVLTDSSLIRRLIVERLRRLSGLSPKLITGKSAITEAVEELATGDLFGEPAPIWIELPEKISQKQWTDYTVQLNHLSEPARCELYILAPAAARHSAPLVKDLPWKADVTLIYEPSRNDAIQILIALMLRYGNAFTQTKKPELIAWAQYAFDYYSGDLEACDLHFERMSRGGFSFEEAIVPKTSLDAFDVIEAISSGDTNLVHLRMGQLEQAGEETSSVVSALNYTGRQVLAFQAALAQTGQNRQAHELARIPYPSQGRIEKLAKLIPPQKWAKFYFAAADLELQSRTRRDAHNWLAVELTGLLN